ncbi:MAG: class I SAM-dependent methyltransferase [Deltaproteobacteria bacterium]|nr:class I SAM-dependent methyltransferase [Deltaproteobacteria bacterium]
MTTLKPVRSHRVYEALGVTDLASQGIRPGGLILTQRLLEFAGLPAGSRIVDIGCGTGVTSEFIRLNYKYQIVGIDWSTELLRHG